MLELFSEFEVQIHINYVYEKERLFSGMDGIDGVY